MSMLAEEMSFDSTDDLIKFVNIPIEDIKKRGRPLKDKEWRQRMYNHWLEKSDISTDRRNGRHIVHKKEA